MALRFDPRTGRVIVGDLSPSIKGNLVTLQDWAALVAYYGEQQAGLLNNLTLMNEKLELLLDKSPSVNFRDKDSKVRPSSFSGNIYSDTKTMTDNNATRFEASPKRLRDVIIIVETNSMLLGKAGDAIYPVGVGDTVGFTLVDISTLYFKNATEDSNGKISILGVEE